MTDDVRISEAELDIMAVLWADSPLSAVDVAARVPATRDWSPTTVKTMLSRLVDKGALGAEAQGRRFLYRPLIDRDPVAGAQAGRLVDRLFGGRISPSGGASRRAARPRPRRPRRARSLDPEFAQMSWLAGNLLVASLLILLVLAIRRPVARLFGARAAYALWLAPALRLVWPPMPEWSPIAARASSPATVYWTQVVVPAGEQLAPLATMLLALWIGGAAVTLGVHLAAHRRFVRRALKLGRPMLVDGVTVDIVATRAVEGPMATGLVHPLILVPHDFEQRFSADQRRFALMHEQLHHRRGDIWASARRLARRLGPVVQPACLRRARGVPPRHGIGLRRLVARRHQPRPGPGLCADHSRQRGPARARFAVRADLDR